MVIGILILLIVAKYEVNSNFRGQHMRDAYLHLGDGFPKNDKREKY